jgi:hypothetical protein
MNNNIIGLKPNRGVKNPLPVLLEMQAQLDFLKSTTRLVGHFSYVPDENPDKDVHRFCQGLSDQFEDLSCRVVAPGATEDPEALEISADIEGIQATLDAITHFSPQMENGEFIEPVSGLFSEFFCYVSRKLMVTRELWGRLY